jgi:hypothetical protein
LRKTYQLEAFSIGAAGAGTRGSSEAARKMVLEGVLERRRESYKRFFEKLQMENDDEWTA